MFQNLVKQKTIPALVEGTHLKGLTVYWGTQIKESGSLHSVGDNRMSDSWMESFNTVENSVLKEGKKQA